MPQPQLIITQEEDQRRLQEAGRIGGRTVLDFLLRAGLLRTSDADDGPSLDEKAVWSNEEAMRYTGWSRATLQRLRSSGELAFSKRGARVFYRREDVLALMLQDLEPEPLAEAA